MNLSRCLGVLPSLLTSIVFVLVALSQKVQGSGKLKNLGVSLSYEQRTVALKSTVLLCHLAMSSVTDYFTF